MEHGVPPETQVAPSAKKNKSFVNSALAAADGSSSVSASTSNNNKYGTISFKFEVYRKKDSNGQAESQ